MTQKKQTTAQTELTVSASTLALINAKCRISTLHSDILIAMEMVAGEERSNQYLDEIGDKLTPIVDLVDKYIIESIDSNLASVDSTEF